MQVIFPGYIHSARVTRVHSYTPHTTKNHSCYLHIIIFFIQHKDFPILPLNLCYCMQHVRCLRWQNRIKDKQHLIEHHSFPPSQVKGIGICSTVVVPLLIRADSVSLNPKGFNILMIVFANNLIQIVSLDAYLVPILDQISPNALENY